MPPAEPLPSRRARARVGARTPALLVWMLLALVTVAGLAYWDEERESRAALEDFAREQVTLAEAVGATMAAALRASAATGAEVSIPALLGDVRSVARAGERLVLVEEPRGGGGGGLMSTDERHVASPPIEGALARGASWVRLGRSEAAALGLPARTAVAGLAHVRAGSRGAWGLAVVATAERERDRQQRAEARLVLGLVLASALVAAFGGAALRNQRKELELARELAIAQAVHERDERLVRADKLATMGALATGIAHEVSTPLGVILGRAEQLQRRVEGDDRATRALEAIIQQAERIHAIVRGLLRLARGDAATLERVAPEEVARAAVALVEHRFARAGVTLALDVAPRLPRVACEPLLFEQVLVNLLLNACDASPRGAGVSLEVRADGERVSFVVIDAGSGISAEAARRATEPFFTTKPAEQGSGLGLAIATEIVKHHRGALAIEARDPPAHGTRARVELPAVAEEGA